MTKPTMPAAATNGGDWRFPPPLQRRGEDAVRQFIETALLALPPGAPQGPMRMAPPTAPSAPGSPPWPIASGVHAAMVQAIAIMPGVKANTMIACLPVGGLS